MKKAKAKGSTTAKKKLSLSKETVKDLETHKKGKGDVKGGWRAVFTDACITKQVATSCCPLCTH
jgi:hypothetical protein